MRGKVLVTGGSGFIGSFLCEALLSRGYEVTVFDIVPPSQAHNLSSVINHSNLTYIHGDITNKSDLESVFNSELEVVFHLSSLVGVKHYMENPLGVIDVNVLGTKYVLELAHQHSVRVLFTSTSEVYGNNPDPPWAESDDRVLGSTTIDRWCYSTSKSLGEHMVLGMHKSKGLPVNIVRFFNVYGPRQSPILVVSQSIKKVIRGEKPLLYDNGNQSRCFTFVKDAVEAVILISENDKTIGEIYNIGSSKETTIKQLMKIVFQVANVEAEFEHVDTSEYYGKNYQDIYRRIPDVSKIKKDLGWSFTTELEEGIRITYEWAKQNSWWLED